MMAKIIKIIWQPWWLFSMAALVFGLLYMTITPPLWGTDETAHFARVYQLAHGDFSPARDSNGAYGGALPKNLVGLWGLTMSDLIDNKGTGVLTRKDVDSVSNYKQFTSQKFSKQTQTSPGSAVYSPAAYIAPIIGVGVADVFNANIGQTIFMARLFSLVLYIGFVFTALRLLRDSKLRWLVFSVALLPICLYQASVVTADNMAIGLSILFAALLTRLIQDKSSPRSRTFFYALVAIAAILPLVKINYVFVSLALVFVPNKHFKSRRFALTAKTAGVVLIAILGLVWSLVGKVASNAAVSQRPDGAKVVSSAQIAYLEHHPTHFVIVCIRSVVKGADPYLQSMTSLIGWNYVSIPLIFMFALCLGIFLAAMNAQRELIPIRKKLLLINALALAGIASIFVALYVAFNPVGNRTVDGIQGRYFLPFLIPAMMLLAAYLPIEIRIKEKVAPFIFGTLAIGCLVVSVLYYYVVTY